MKKLVFAMMAFFAISLISCVDKNANANGTDAIDSLKDTAAVVAGDSLKPAEGDSAEAAKPAAETAPEAAKEEVKK